MDTSEEYTFAELLKQFRARARMSQQDLAELLKEYRPKMHRNTISAWECGEYLPESLEMVQKVANALMLSIKDTELLIRVARERTTTRIIWNVPHQRNPLFTGRETILTRLHVQLHQKLTVALTQTHAIHGLGGIGKTQTVVEYAYRYRHHYQAVLWLQADTENTLINGYIFLAKLLHLPEKDMQEQQRIIDAIKRWLSEHVQWLLILDNVEDIRTVKTFLPTMYSGHVLLTTRSQALGGIAQGIMLEQMEPNEGILFLLRRAAIVRLDETLDQVDIAKLAEATTIVKELEALPLALDQAGAYLEETQCSLAQYLQHYRVYQAKLLKRRGRLATDTDHPESVVTTWSLSFKKIEQTNPMAADLLRLCAFLHPDAIPEEIIMQGAKHLGPALAPIARNLMGLDDAIAALIDYSLLQRNSENRTLSLHRLVQAVLRDEIGKASAQVWMERVIKMIIATLPVVEYEHWPAWERLIEQAQVCTEWIRKTRLHSEEAAFLLQQVGRYLTARSWQVQAEPLLIRSLRIWEQQPDPWSPGKISCLNALTSVYIYACRYKKAERAAQLAFGSCMLKLGPDHLDTAESVQNLALLRAEQGKPELAKLYAELAVALYARQLGLEHFKTAKSFTFLAHICAVLGDLTQAEMLLQRSLAIQEQQLEPGHPDIIRSLEYLYLVYKSQDKNAQAETFLQRALTAFQEFGDRNYPSKLDQKILRVPILSSLEDAAHENHESFS